MSPNRQEVEKIKNNKNEENEKENQKALAAAMLRFVILRVLYLLSQGEQRVEIRFSNNSSHVAIVTR